MGAGRTSSPTLGLGSARIDVLRATFRVKVVRRRAGFKVFSCFTEGSRVFFVRRRRGFKVFSYLSSQSCAQAQGF